MAEAHRLGGKEESDLPFGRYGYQTGITAAGTAYLLFEDHPKPTERRYTWRKNDKDAFASLHDIILCVPEDEVSPDLSPRAQVRYKRLLDAKLGAVYGALPFTEPERRWLFDRPMGDLHLEDLRYEETEILDAGIRRVIRGRQLMRQWWMWRRDAGPYEGQGGVLAAATALFDIAKLTTNLEDPQADFASPS